MNALQGYPSRKRQSVKCGWIMLVILGLWGVFGCSARREEESAKPAARQKSNTKRRVSGIGRSRKVASRQRRQYSRRPAEQRVRAGRAREVESTGPATGYRSARAVERVTTIIRDSIDFAPTSVVWLIDVSPSAIRWGSEIRAAISQFYTADVPSLVAGKQDRFQTAIITIGEKATLVLDMMDRVGTVAEVMDDLRVDSSGQEATFQAVKLALEKYLSVRTKQRREVLLIIVSDEAGDDWKLVDQLVQQPRKYAIPIYVIGVPAPFGRTTALPATIEAPKRARAGDAWQPILQGPESRYLERLSLPIEGTGPDMNLMDSGFGPFGLERLCRASGGSFLAVWPKRSGASFVIGERQVWPSGETIGFDPKVMSRYVPDQVDDAAYQALLAGNKACMALHRAAKRPRAEVLSSPVLDFEKRSEPELKRLLDSAQRGAAKVAPSVDELYELLKEGNADREKLQSPRWQAGYDLAFGRICATKARIDGYNAMLAALKRGRSFKNANSQRWILEPAESTEASSSLRNLAKRARKYLQRVVTDHPGTPWAKVAQQELKQPMGWKWTESE